MQKLDLNSPALTRLPASAFPGRADVYLCDKCERDITRYLRPGRPHASAPMRRERYLCPCGEKYLTGATEWDHLGHRERLRRIQQTIVFGVAFSVISVILAIPAYFILKLFVPAFAVVVSISIGAFPFAVSQMIFWSRVIASVWRTRVAGKKPRACSYRIP
jgi:hypothetical protein